MNSSEIAEYLTSKDIKLSVQRIAIMEYLAHNRCHPTVDQIFNELNPKMPTLSKTTIYNTLKLFVEKGAALRLDVDDKEAHYDGDLSTTAHFYCLGCGAIYDIYSNVLAPEKAPELEGMEIVETRVYFKGYCKDCIAKRGSD